MSEIIKNLKGGQVNEKAVICIVDYFHGVVNVFECYSLRG